MLVTMKRSEFEVLDDKALGSVCFKPLIQAYKEALTRGDDGNKLYSELSKGQQALFIFHVYYAHASKSEVELYMWSAYFIAQSGRWPALLSGYSYLGDDESGNLLSNIENVLMKRNHPRSKENLDISESDLANDPELLVYFKSFYIKYLETTPITIKLIAQYIRKNPSEFVQFINE